MTGADISSIAEVAAAEDVILRPLFGQEDRLLVEADAAAPDAAAAEVVERMARCYHAEAPDERLDDLAARLRALDTVEAAYVKPAAEPATVLDRVDHGLLEGINDMAPTGPEATAATPDYVSRQGYLDASPGGIDARYAWTVSGGRGGGTRVVDCEWGWRFTHEDLRTNQSGVIAGTGSTDTNHGTAVLGEISGDVNAFGITGIAPDAVISASAFSVPTSTAIKAAADRLVAGDIILLEVHRAGPNATGVGQQGFIAIEWWPDDYLAIRYAVNRGIVVVEAAGNGAEDLDAAAYETAQAGFPSWWRNPFRRAALDAGAVIVGAGAPPPGTHGRTWGPDRSRLDFSNFGACVDAQGWGREVTTTGYGDLQGGSNQDLWYTDTFSGTSSASPIVVGALACAQGALRAVGRPLLSPARARELLRSTGSPQQDAPGRPASQRIGNRPDLRQLLPAALRTGTWTGVQFRGTVPAGATKRWFTHSWPAHWHVLWTVIPTTPRAGAPQVRWRTRVERASDAAATYWIDITNTTTSPVDIEARYAVLGW
ncbi:S8 family serine peptidase [Actinomycetospora lutea]|uniref:S8 family serine peptidase n=1 Tax=Actinomycetospora lutea TaxID=663604 RepID=UPI002366D08F|nr:S8 family serine peptidase [Actinomycetospora lutea]MDD7942407.1 S8 family serine peptidase [Actinomycetospora lutea]